MVRLLLQHACAHRSVDATRLLEHLAFPPSRIQSEGAKASGGTAPRGRGGGAGGISRRLAAGDGGESFLRVDWVAVPQAMRARRVNRGRRRRRRRSRTCGVGAR
eukprot:COSAG01_NODE_2087_length_8456_cov_2.656456_6_plen_104_part_00